MSCSRALLCILAFVLLGLVLASCATRAAETTTPSPTAPPFSAPHPILSDLRVRRGIAHCTDRAGLIRSVYPYLEETDTLEMDSFLPSSHWAYPAGDTSFLRYPFDPEKGKALFEQAGWTLAAGATYRANVNGEEMSLTLTSTQAQFRQTWLAVIEEQMKACGLKIIRNHLPVVLADRYDGNPARRRALFHPRMGLRRAYDADCLSVLFFRTACHTDDYHTLHPAKRYYEILFPGKRGCTRSEFHPS